MAYTAKTNWALDNIVLPADMNRIETGIKEAHDSVAAGGKFATPMKLSLAGGATGEVTFDGTQNVTLNVGVSATGHTHSNVTTSANGMMLSADKSKLDGIASGATRTIIHNTLTGTSTTEALSAAQGKALKDLVDGKAATSHTHAISDITNLQTELNGKAASSHTQAISTITGLQAALDGKAPTVHAHSVAVKSTDNEGGSHGFMSAQDKEKLDGIATGATKTTIVDNLTSSSTTSALSANQGKVLNNNYDFLVTLVDNKAGKEVATTTTNGLMSSPDKVKLNGIEAGATKTTLTNIYDGASTSIALSQYGGRSLFSELKQRGDITHTAYSGAPNVNQWIESTGASTTNTSVLSSGQSISISLSTGGYLPTDTIFLSSTLTNYQGLYLDNMKRTGGYTMSARVINISGATFNYLDRCEWNILYSYQRS